MSVCVCAGTRGLTAHLGIVEEATATSEAMLRQVFCVFKHVHQRVDRSCCL